MNFRIILLSIINWLVPKRNNQIAIYGRRMLNDNAETLLDYLIDEKYNNRYTIKVCITKEVNSSKYSNTHNVIIVHNPISTILTLFRSLRIFHTHGMSVCSFIPCRKQIIFNLWHGSPLKTIGALASNICHPETDSYFLCASPFFATINKRCFLLNDKQVFIGSNPRNDLLFTNSNNDYLNKIRQGRKVIVYMPTFRKSEGLGRKDSNIDFPLINQANIQPLDTFLAQNNLLLIIKPHPYQNHIRLFDAKCSNIIILKNEDLNRNGLHLYELLASTDALISDYSSVYFDYLLLNRPIAFVTIDLDSYQGLRGFTVENPYDIMPGAKIKDLNDFKQFLLDVANNNDLYKDDRQRVNDLSNAYKSNDASKRILDFLNITK